MTNPSQLKEKIVSLLQQAGHDHHQAFQDVGGADAEWPTWYATYLHPYMRELTRPDLTISELVYWLVGADRSYRKEGPAVEWPEYYAAYYVENMS
jgi:hypothetical protein